MRHLNRFGIILIVFVSVFTRVQAEETNNWPKIIERDGTSITIYQPQTESLSANTMESRAAVSVTTRENPAPVFGAMWFDCNISTDMDDRTVKLLNMEVSAAKFPDVEAEKIERMSELLKEEVPRWEMELSLDQLLADLDLEEVHMELSEGLNNAAPEIIYSTAPAMLIMVDGDPRFEQIEKTSYERVVNTPYFIVGDSKKGKYYINGGKHWYVSDNFDRWEVTSQVPKKLIKIAEEAMEEEEAYAASTEDESVVYSEDVTPVIIVRTTPAELLQSDGEPEFKSIEGTSLLFMSNTADDILMNIETQDYYVLVAGRWYRSKSLSGGPWSFVDPENIPEGFSSIPADSDMASVRSSIAGTREAKEALLANQIPQTAAVDRHEARLEVSYDGYARFEKVGNTDMNYAVNTDKSVLQINNHYYCCDNAIWFEANSPNGPWIVSTEVPPGVQEIPPESPVYNVKYVYIYDTTPDVVYVGYTPGYLHSYAYRGCVYYGTGYYYRPWYGVRYYPRPVTYGYRAHWNPYTGWGFSFGYSYGWMTYGWGSPYRGWWGPSGYRYGYHYGYRHSYSAGYRDGYHAGRRSSYRQPAPYAYRPRPTNNVYNNRAQGIRSTGNNYYDARTGYRVASTDRPVKPTARTASSPNNIYTDRQGNVYRRDGNDWNRVNNKRVAPPLDNRSSTTRQPSTRENRPTTTQQPAVRQQPSTRQQPAARPQPAVRQQAPTRQQPAVRQQAVPSDRSSNTYTRPGSAGSGTLNRDYDSRTKGAARSQQYQQSKPEYQQSKPSPAAVKSSKRPVSTSSSGSGRSTSTTRKR